MEENSEDTAVLDADELVIREVSEGFESLILEESDVEIVEESINDDAQDETTDEAEMSAEPICSEQKKTYIKAERNYGIFSKKNH